MPGPSPRSATVYDICDLSDAAAVEYKGTAPLKKLPLIFSNKKSVVLRRPIELTRELGQSQRFNITAKLQYHLN